MNDPGAAEGATAEARSVPNGNSSQQDSAGSVSGDAGATVAPAIAVDRGALHETVVFTYETKIWDTDEDSFSAAGRQYYAHAHGFRAGDRILVTIRKLHDHEGAGA